MTASHGRRRSNTSPSISQAPRTARAPTPLESGGRCLPAHGERRPAGRRISQAPASDDRGGGTPAVRAFMRRELIRQCSDHRQPILRRPPRRTRCRDVATMLDDIGVGSLDELAPRRCPRASSTRDRRLAPGSTSCPGRDRARGARRTGRAGRAEHRRDVDDRARLLRHAHPAGAAPQHPREPGLVHRLHPVPARDQPGPARGAAQLPDHGRRPDRHGGRQRVDARRGAPPPPRR